MAGNLAGSLCSKIGQEGHHTGGLADLGVVGYGDGWQMGLLLVVISVQEDPHPHVERPVESLDPIGLRIVWRWMGQADLQLGVQGSKDSAGELHAIVTVDRRGHPKVAM